MEVYVQYTLELTNNPVDGELVLGGHATKHIAYKPVTALHSNRAGWQGEQLLVGDQSVEKHLQRQVERSLSLQVFEVRLAHTDDFMKVFEIVLRAKQKYDHDRKDFVKQPEKRTCLVIFMRCIPVHVPGMFKDYLRELNLLPQKQPYLDKANDDFMLVQP